LFTATTVAAASVLFIAAGFGLYFYPVALHWWLRRRRRRYAKKARRNAA
jgi:uncharacterized protein (DUF2062 family)